MWNIRILLTAFFIVILSSLLECGSRSQAVEINPSPQQDIMKCAEETIRQTLLKLRVEPEEVIHSMITAESDNDSIQDGNFLDSLIFPEVMPLVQNSSLDVAAKKLCQTSIISGDINFMDANSTKSLLNDYEYSAVKVDIKASAVLLGEYMDANESARVLLYNFVKTLKEQLKSGEKPSFFDPDYVEIGTAFCGGTVSLPDTESANIYLMLIILARPAGPQPYWIQCGHVYNDYDDNNEFNADEGLEHVIMTDDNGTILSETTSDGRYCFRRPKGNWILYLESFPFEQNFLNYSLLIKNQTDGILWQDYKLLLNQEYIDLKREITDETP